MDYNSDPFNITINAVATEGRANISVTCDDEVEGSENFDMRLTLRRGSNGVTLGRDTSVGEIMDSTGVYINLCNLVKYHTIKQLWSASISHHMK